MVTALLPEQPFGAPMTKRDICTVFCCIVLFHLCCLNLIELLFESIHQQQVIHLLFPDVWGMYVIPDLRGQGVGRLLLRELIKQSGSLEGLEQLDLADMSAAYFSSSALSNHFSGDKTASSNLNSNIYTHLYPSLKPLQGRSDLNFSSLGVSI